MPKGKGYDMLTPVDRPFIILLISGSLTNISNVFMLGVIVMSLDIVARWRDFKKIEGSRFSTSKAYRYRTSWCSRGVACYTWGAPAILYYRSLGYKPWHILPDDAPICFFSIKFWKGVIGV